MSKLSSYVNEIISFVVMLLLLAALVTGQINAQAYKLAALDIGAGDRTEIQNVRLEDE
jgi:archaellum component FlaG (FlaF/FlaG flagellin family)